MNQATGTFLLSDSIVIVTGLPRSGTSMMMQMLQAGGIEPYADDHRPADKSNERGYYEHKNVKQIATNSSWIGEAKGMAVKVVAPLLQFLPMEHKYYIVLMRRPVGQVIRSQQKMLARLKKLGNAMGFDELKTSYDSQLKVARNWLELRQTYKMLKYTEVNFEGVVAQPETTTQRLSEFLGTPFDATKAARVVNSNLRHERS